MVETIHKKLEFLITVAEQRSERVKANILKQALQTIKDLEEKNKDLEEQLQNDKGEEPDESIIRNSGHNSSTNENSVDGGETND